MMNTGDWGSILILKHRIRTFVFIIVFMGLGSVFSPKSAWTQESRLIFMPDEPLYNSLIGDPREPQCAIIAQTSQSRYEGLIGKTIELLQWTPKDGPDWGWGIEGASFIELDSLGGGVFPERVSDWYLGMYFSESEGDLSNRLEYIHVSSHLGDELFDTVQRFIYTRESFRFTSSYTPVDNLRLYAGVGYWGHMAPADKPFFIHCGTELYTDPFHFIAGTFGRGYFTCDLKFKDEAGGVVDQAYQFGLKWTWKKDSHQAIRMAVLYDNGNSEYGQFYRQQDNRWGLGIYFDP
jgi:hypothetical protein